MSALDGAALVEAPCESCDGKGWEPAISSAGKVLKHGREPCDDCNGTGTRRVLVAPRAVTREEMDAFAGDFDSPALTYLAWAWERESVPCGVTHLPTPCADDHPGRVWLVPCPDCKSEPDHGVLRQPCPTCGKDGEYLSITALADATAEERKAARRRCERPATEHHKCGPPADGLVVAAEVR